MHFCGPSIFGPVYAIKAYSARRGIAPPALTSVLGGYEHSTSRPASFLQESTPGTLSKEAG